MINFAASGDVEGELAADELIRLVEISHVSEIRTAAENLTRISRARGLKVALCPNIASTKPMVDADGFHLHEDVFGWRNQGERWWEQNDFALECPVPRACRYESDVFWCDRNGFHVNHRNPFLEGIDLNDHFDKTGDVHRGEIIVPVHLPFGQVSANNLVVAKDDPRDTFEVFELYGKLFGVLIRQFIHDYTKVAPDHQHIPRDCQLGKRDVQCLRWLAMGKTDLEIATLLGLGRSTVRYHLNQICKKLNAVNRTQAVYKASQLGYIGPPSPPHGMDKYAS